MAELSFKQKLNFIAIIALVALFAFGIFVYWAAMNSPSSRDLDDVKNVASAIKYPFPKGHHPNIDGRPSLYFRPHPRRSEIIIYGVQDQGQQDDIIAMIRQGQEKVPNKPVVVTFLVREEWGRENGGSGFQRGKEKTIRCLTVEAKRNKVA